MYYRQDVRRGMFPSARQQRFGPPQMSNQSYGPPRPNPFSRLRDAFYSSQGQQQFNPYQQGPNPRQWQQQYNPYQQAPDPRQWQQPNDPFQQAPGPGSGSLSDNLNTMMGHVGTITNGINMMRQVGSIFSLFR